MVANFWLRPGNTSSSNNILEFLSATLRHLGRKTVGLLRADSGFFDEAVMNFLHARQIAFIISARLTQPLQQRVVSQCQFWVIAPGLEIGGDQLPSLKLEGGPADCGGPPKRQSARASAGQDLEAVCRRSGHTRLALWGDGDLAGAARLAGVAPVPGAG